MTIKLYELCGADREMVFSPHCWKVRMALAHKGLDYEAVPIGFSQVSTVENGEGCLVPVMVDDGAIIQDSFQIAKHLDEKYGDRPSLFTDECGMAAARFIEAWSQSQLHPVVTRMVLIQIYQSLNEADQAHFRASREKRLGMTLEEFSASRGASTTDLHNALVPLETMLTKQPFIGGQSPVFADYIVFGAIQWLRVFKGKPLMKKDSKAETWMEALVDLHDGAGRNAKLAA